MLGLVVAATPFRPTSTAGSIPRRTAEPVATCHPQTRFEAIDASRWLAPLPPRSGTQPIGSRY